MGVAHNLAYVDTATGSVSVGAASAAQTGFNVGKILIWGARPGETVEVLANLRDGSGIISLDRGALNSTPYPHRAGDGFYEPVVQPDTGTGKMNEMDSFDWPDTVQAVTNADTASEFQRSRTIRGSFIVKAIQIVAGNTGPNGTSGQFTKIRISKGDYSAGGAYIEATLAYGSNRGAVATGSMILSDGDTLYAWIADARGGHGKVQLKIMG